MLPPTSWTISGRGTTAWVAAYSRLPQPPGVSTPAAAASLPHSGTRAWPPDVRKAVPATRQVAARKVVPTVVRVPPVIAVEHDEHTGGPEALATTALAARPRRTLTRIPPRPRGTVVPVHGRARTTDCQSTRTMMQPMTRSGRRVVGWTPLKLPRCAHIPIPQIHYEVARAGRGARRRKQR